MPAPPPSTSRAAADGLTSGSPLNRLAIELYDDDGCHCIQNGPVQIQHRPAFCRSQLDGRPVGQTIRALDVVLYGGNLERSAWLVEEREKQLARLGRHPPV